MADKKNKLIPAPGYVLVEPLEGKKETDSGIVLPESVEEKPLKGKVVGVGEAEITDSGAERKIWKEVKEGVNIIYKKWAGNEYQPSGSDKEMLFVKFEDILAVAK
jgi:chaperonin GroES